MDVKTLKFGCDLWDTVYQKPEELYMSMKLSKRIRTFKMFHFPYLGYNIKLLEGFH
jgi:hypothetical protein